MRIRGIQLAVVTMALGVALGTILFTNRWFIGNTGALPIEAPDLFELTLPLMWARILIVGNMASCS